MYVFPEAASRAIVQFLEVNQSEETSRGWMLLTTINLLASSGQVGRRKGGSFRTHCVFWLFLSPCFSSIPQPVREMQALWLENFLTRHL